MVSIRAAEEAVLKAAEDARKHLVNLVGIRDGGVRAHERRGRLGALHALCDAVDDLNEARAQKEIWRL